MAQRGLYRPDPALPSAAKEAAIPPTTPTPRPRPLRDLAWRTIFRLGFPVARLWWRLSRPHHEGALVAVRVGPSVLILRSSYRRAWNLPGGGIRPGEPPYDAARRELAEELGLAVPALDPVGTASGRWDGRRDRVHLFELRLDRLPPLRLDNREIIAARLATLDELRDLELTGPLAAYRDTLAAEPPKPPPPAP